MEQNMMEKLALLKALQDSREDSDQELYVSSLNDADILLKGHMNASGAKFRRRLVEYMVDPAHRVMGPPGQYHNFIMDLFRVGDFDLGLKICEMLLEFVPYHRDILGDAIKACGDTFQFDKGEEYLQRAEQISHELWSFRLFCYSVEFLKNKLNANVRDDKLYQRALHLAEEYIHYYPFDEHGYNLKAELMILRNQRTEAIATLSSYIFDTSPDKGDRKSELVTGQCCVSLLNLLDCSSQYGEIIKICNRGLRNTTMEQPSASIAFFLYRKALALDAIATARGYEVPAEVEAALECYQAAYDLNQDHDYGRTIEMRYAVLRPHSKAFKPLVKRPLFVTEEEPAITGIDEDA